MLNRLMEYARSHDLAAEPGFARKDVRWALVLGEDGRFLDVIELGDVEAKRNSGRIFPQSPDMPRPILQGGGKCHFLVESVEVITLFLDKKSNPEKIKGKHDYYCMLLKQAASTMPELALAASSLQDESNLTTLHTILQEKKVKPTESCTIAFGTSFPLESEAWRAWWRTFLKGIRGTDNTDRVEDAEERTLIDLLTGDPCQPLSSHPKIKGLSAVGGLAMGDSMVSFDKEAFQSYNLDSGRNAAMSDQSAAVYSEVLNGLVKDHGKRLCGAMAVHWFKEKVQPEDDPLAWLEEGEDQESPAQHRAGQLLEGLRQGKRVDLMNNFYYALTLSGASGRVMVRDWMEGQFEELAVNIDSWFNDLSIIRPDSGGFARPPKFLAVIGSTVRDLDDAPASMISSLWRAAVKGETIPFHVMARALNRVRVSIGQDNPINTSAIGLLLAYHLRKNRMEGGKHMSEDLKPTLNENHPNPAYHCGRLMAVLAGLQRAALGDVGAGVVQRYYAAASATPALILGRLARLGQFHLSKLDSPRLAFWYEEKMSAIWGRMGDGAPATLTLEEQSLFALGYYQQLADLRTKKIETSETKKED